ncbi:Bacterial protein of uncharacterised function (DUF883) [Bordetella ansorpii]|uniref:Bacterial protein of uncharacterized function (DUF883) n=1 Tax=Bordetella ansorpii TaxID=288768 RepID=A0A157SWL8_9BORD|nr:DUF883 family protein [Bordetella ansorpii]SAI74878.1 Bacterial protein of uncharacterised function (DUF883) [Bordetella ansorpii]
MDLQDRATPFSDDGMRTLRSRTARQQQWLDELDAILNDSSHTDVETLRARVQAQLGKTRAAFDALSESTTDLAHEARQCAENYVQDRPWQSLGAAAGIGLLVGMLIGRN